MLLSTLSWVILGMTIQAHAVTDCDSGIWTDFCRRSGKSVRPWWPTARPKHCSRKSRCAQKRISASHFNVIWVVQIARQKIFRFSFPPNQLHLRAIPPHEEGRTRRHDTWSAGCGGREALRARGIAGRSQALSWGCERSIRAGRAALLRTAKACGSGTRGWCQAGGGCSNPTGFAGPSIRQTTEAKGIRLRGERAISRQTIAQGRPDALRWTCMLVCALLCAIAHETAGAARTRSSLRPLIPERASGQVQLGRVAPRERAGISASHGLIRFPPIIIPS